MGDFIFDGNDGHFIIESGSSSVPVFKVSGSTTYISGLRSICRVSINIILR